ncbi:MAG: hypothetical protein AAF599_04915 [Bacteroidota bacterium]
MTQIVEIAGLKATTRYGNRVGKVNAPFPKRIYIPFSQVSSSESKLLIQARKNLVYGTVAARKGDLATFERNTRMGEELYNVYAKGIHSLSNTNSRDRMVGSEVNRMVNGLKRVERPALNLNENLAGIGNCTIGLDDANSQRIQNNVRLALGPRPECGLLASGRCKADQRSWDDEFNFEFNTRSRLFLADQVLNCFMEDNGPAMTYALWGFAEYNQRVSQKFFAAENWINQIATGTGIDRETIFDLLKTGFALHVKETPEQARNTAIDAFTISNSINGIGAIDPATVTLIVQLVKVVALLIGAVIGFIDSVKQLQLVDQTTRAIPTPGTFNPSCADPDFGGLTPVNKNGVPLECDFRTGQFKTGAEKNKLIGYAALAGGAWLLLTSDKK